jgi:LysR family transcriptional regulator, salicylic acid-responsive activator of bsdBCD
MDIRQLRYFLTIAEEEQITSAAKRLHIAQPPLSQQLKSLENELGVKLVERGSRKIQLTDAGQILRNRAEQILELTEATTKELKDFSEGVQGTLSIGAVSSSGATLLPERIHSFHTKCPGINFEIWEGNTYRILEILNSGVIEIGIVRTPFNIENFESIPLAIEPMVAAISGNLYFEEHQNHIYLTDLVDKPLIIYRRFEKIILQSCQKAGFEPKIFCKTDDARTTLLWADSGMGIAIVPKSAVELIRSSNIKYKEIKESSLATQIVAIWMKNRYLSTAARHFLETFKE